MRRNPLRPGTRRPLCTAAGVLCAAVALAQVGCVTRTPLATDYAGPDEMPSELAEQFAHDSLASDRGLDRDELRDRRDFTVHRIVLPAAERDADGPIGEVAFEYYEIDGSETTPVVIVLPIANGNMRVSRYFGRFFADRGWAALVVDRLEDPLQDILGDPELIIRRNVRDYRRVLDWVEQEPALGAVGVFGISFGGMAAIMLGALDDRVDALVVAMAGGDLPYMMVNTSYRGMARQIHRELRETGVSRERLEARLAERITSDPLKFAPYVDAEDVLLVMTRTDMIVPIETQRWLREQLGEPQTLSLPTGHRTSVFYFPLLRHSAYSFFENKFSAAH